ncbi:ABC-three component system protein [Pseudomonas sp. L1(2025)]|uniref:ABC-three component system protein n=1 Tax=Pseudomonas sp. L1(2025) TaxID=3449429 RepID=UPI003F691F3E
MALAYIKIWWGCTVVSPEKKITDNCAEFIFNYSVLDNKKLDLCLIQTPAPDFCLVEGDKSRPSSVNVLQELFAGGGAHQQPVLNEILPRSSMSLVLMPEFAFGHEDWDDLDAAVRSSQSPVILIVGFGATLGEALRLWKAAPGETERHLAWDGAISSTKLVNGGWCWVHQPGARTDCIVWMKNVAEQRTEAVKFQNMQFGREVVHLRFNDLSVFPIICADLLESVSSIDSTQNKIMRAITIDNRPDTPVLITGSLWQSGYNRNWEVAVGDILRHVFKRRPGALALCNIAYDKPDCSENADKWRSMSGVFVSFEDLPKCQQHLHAGRALETSNISGVVIRDTKACLVAGKLSWRPFTPVAGQFLWHPDLLCHITPSGIDLLSSMNNTTIRCEILRNVRRFPSRADWDPRVARGLNELRSKAGVFSEKLLEKLVSYILAGTADIVSTEPDLLHEKESYHEGIYAIAALKTLDQADWLEDETQDGHLVSAGVTNLLVWHDRNRTYRFVRKRIEEWLEDPNTHPNLIVFGSAAGQAEEGEVYVSARSDICTPALSTSGLDSDFFDEDDSITEYKVTRRAALYSLDKVSGMYKDFVPSEATERAGELQNVIGSAFCGGR